LEKLGKNIHIISGQGVSLNIPAESNDSEIVLGFCNGEAAYNKWATQTMERGVKVKNKYKLAMKI